MQNILDKVSKGEAMYIIPYKEPKVWGVGGIGEYWYGAEGGGKSSIARIGEETFPLDKIIKKLPEEVLGAKAIKKFGNMLPLVKILTPKGRLSVQFHDKKNELWIITGINRDLIKGDPYIILGFSPESVKEFGDEVALEYEKVLNEYGKSLNELISSLEKTEKGRKALEKTKNAELAANLLRDEDTEILEKLKKYKSQEKKVDGFYGKVKVKKGDVIPVASGTLHALGSGIEIIEPQIFGETQSLEDGATYPVRYAFSDYPRDTASKNLDVDRATEMIPSVAKKEVPEIILQEDDIKIEKLPGNFEDKGLEVHRITMAEGKEITVPVSSFHNLVVVDGDASVYVNNNKSTIPKASPGHEMLLVPFKAGHYRIVANRNSQIIDTFTPVA